MKTTVSQNIIINQPEMSVLPMWQDPILILCALPAIAAVALLFIPNKLYPLLRAAVMASSVGTCFLAQYQLMYTPYIIGYNSPNVYPWLFSDQSSNQFCFSVSVGVDGISFFFILLTTLIFPFCFLGIYKKRKDLKFYCFCLLFLESFLLFAFSVSDLFLFYIFFEAVLIPMFFVIGIWGSGYERIKAAYYFFFFTLIGSVFFLAAILVIYTVTGTTLFYIILNTDFID